MTCPWHLLRSTHTRLLRARLVQRYKPATVNNHLGALRGVLKQCWRMGLMGTREYYHAVDFKCARVALGQRRLKADELQRVFLSCDDDSGPLAIRDAPVLALLYGGGLRRFEITSLRHRDYDGDAVTISDLRANRRTIPLSGGVRERLDAWLELRGPRHGCSFFRLSKSGRIVPKGLVGDSVLLICHRRAEAAGIDRFSPNDLRRSYVADLLEAGADVVAVRRLAGFRDRSSTPPYVLLSYRTGGI